MEANDFIANLKANDTEKDVCDLKKVFDDYKTILCMLPAKDRGPFSVNVLCIICRNLDKAPTWRVRIHNEALLTLSIDCVRETRALDKADRVKTLACIYHIHKHAVRLNKPVPPELILKISFMPFETESKHLLQEYYKTYWNILADRLTYIERLKTKVNIVKLLPKLTEDTSKVIDIYDTVQFCSTILQFLIKKLHFLYNELHAKELSQAFAQLFSKLTMKDTKLFKNLSERENLAIYVKLNDCLYVIAENASKIHFKDCMLDSIVRTCISFVGHSSDLFHCLQTFYLNCFCSILSSNTNLIYTETVLSSLQNSFETTERLGYKKAMYASYPYLYQFLRLYIDYNIVNCSTRKWREHFDIQIQENCLNLILFLMRKLKNCRQLSKCENCRALSGLHDSLRLSFLIKHFITISLSQNIPISNIQPIFYTIINEQYKVLTELNTVGCTNYKNCFRKLQTDVHNTAISLHKAQHFEFSIKLFDIYLQHELKCSVTEQKNISRALYNKSICELDCKIYENALIDAFLSLILCHPEGLNSDKYMSLVMDIKAKELKSKTNDEIEETETDTMQLISVLDACKLALERKLYGGLEVYMSELKFSTLLKHEFDMYTKLWPSIAPVGGVWHSLLDLANGNYEDWMAVEDEAIILEVLYRVLLETPSAVRTIHSEYFTRVVDELLDKFDKTPKLTPDLKLVHATLLLLKFEFDMAEASQKYRWKGPDSLQSMDPDQVPANRTIPQEHAATARAIVAVRLLTDLSPAIQQVSKTYLRPALKIIDVFVPLLLHLRRDVQGLQLAYICCQIAETVGDDEVYIRNAGTLIYSASLSSPSLDRIFARAGEKCRARGDDTALAFLCEAAIYYWNIGAAQVSVRLVRAAQAQVLAACRREPDVNLDLAVGRLLEAQTFLCKDTPTALTSVNGTQRHYLSISTSGSKWSSRRLRWACVRQRTSAPARAAAALPRALACWRRARAAALPALHPAAAPGRAGLYVEIVDTSRFDDAQIKIDNRLKHILGLLPSNETQPYYATPNTTKLAPFTPKQDLEPMRDNMVFKKTQTSPSLPCMSVPAFKTPDFFNHSSKCTCYACEIPISFVLACKTSGLEACMYGRANENEIASNYFNGVLDMFSTVDKKLRDVEKNYKEIYEDFIVESIMKAYQKEIQRTHLEVLIELSFFELKSKNFDSSDEYIVRIHEILQENGCVDRYISTEVMNLVITSAQLKKVVKKPEETGLEVEFESLRLSPAKEMDPPRTPANKNMKPPKPAPKKIVRGEELPEKRKVIKLDLGDENADENDFEIPTRRTRGVKKAEFKVPNPITSKPVLEQATPRPTRSVPGILITQPSQDAATPKMQPKMQNAEKTKNDFFTPTQNTPEQFFTPMTSVKTYSKKSLRQNIVKNLEREFSTPKSTPSLEKENKYSSKNIPAVSSLSALNMPQKSTAKRDEATKTLKRATSPGKLCKEKKEISTRTRRLRQNVNFSVEEDEKK